MQPIVEQWSKLFIQAMHDERDRSPVTLTLITHRVLSRGSAVLVATVRNESRHVVKKLRITLRNDRDDGGEDGGPARVVEVGSLAPQQQERVHFPGIAAGPGVHGVTFQLAYLDGDEQARHESVAFSFEAFSDRAVYLPIPNPYVTGAPLRAESATFFSRHDELAFLQYAVTDGPAGSAVVLTGEKRTQDLFPN